MNHIDMGVVQVDLDRLDRLLNLVGEFVITRTSFVEYARRSRTQYGFKEQVLNLIENTEHIGRIGEEIQSKIIKARLVPVGSVFGRFNNLLKALAKNTDKKARLEIFGEKTEVDKRTIDELAEPLVHLVRNAYDHGLETTKERKCQAKEIEGCIQLKAHHQGNRLIVEVRDDGAGIDIENVKEKAISKGLLAPVDAEQLSETDVYDLLFQPGFSTRQRLTDMSGRGVGLDAAKRRVVALGGSLTLSSEIGKGTCALIELPLTTAIVDALMVRIGQEVYAIPLEHVHEIVRARKHEIGTVEGHEVLNLRDQALSLVHLTELVGIDRTNYQENDVLQVVVVHFQEQKVGLVVDQIQERHEIVIKALGRKLAGIRGLAGASIGGDGNVVMVLDVPTLCADTLKSVNNEKRSVH